MLRLNKGGKRERGSERAKFSYPLQHNCFPGYRALLRILFSGIFISILLHPGFQSDCIAE